MHETRREPRTPPVPPEDDFVSRYANLDEASVVSPDAENFVPEPEAPAPSRRDNTDALKAAEESVPAAIRDYLAKEFRVKFDRYVPAEEVRIFSIRGEIETGDNTDSPAEEIDVSPDEDD